MAQAHLAAEPRESPADATRRELCGVIDKVIYQQPDSDWCVLRLRGGESVCGEIPISAADRHLAVRLFGRWVDHPRFGQQFRFDVYAYDTPVSAEGMIRYLMRVCNLTQLRAGKLWEAYGRACVEVLRTDPDAVVAAGHLEAEKARAAAKALDRLSDAEQTRIELFDLFAGRGFPAKTIESAIEHWGIRAPAVIRGDPFRMLVAKIGGCGFTRADKLYTDLGLRIDRLKRLMLCGWWNCHSNAEGHTWFRGGILRQPIRKMIVQAARETGEEPDLDRFDRAVELGIRTRWLAKLIDSDGTDWYTTARRARAERLVATAVARLLDGTPMWPKLPQDRLSAHQYEQVAPILLSPFAILAGCPGTGKTYTAAALLQSLVSHYGSSGIVVLAPTGKAAVRITEAMQEYKVGLRATTIHRFLGVCGNGDNGFEFRHHAGSPFAAKIVVCDEWSMCDVEIAAALFSAAPRGTNFLLIGDPHQLPPVQHGAVLRDLIAAGIPTAELTEIQRNSGLIVESCHRIKDGKPFVSCDRYDPSEPEKNLRLIATEDPADQVQKLMLLVQRIPELNYDPVWDTQVLVARNNGSPVSRMALNKVLQNILNPLDTDHPHWASTAHEFRKGDKVICLRNSLLDQAQLQPGGEEDVVTDYEAADESSFVANGDMGCVMAVSDTQIVITFRLPNRTVRLGVKRRKNEEPTDDPEAGTDEADANDFALAYAATVHKAQGSEWPVTILVIDDAAGMVCSREHIYTGMSRGKKIVYLVGRRATAERYCKQAPSLAKRKTFLRELLVDQYRQGPRHENGRFNLRLPALNLASILPGK